MMQGYTRRSGTMHTTWVIDIMIPRAWNRIRGWLVDGRKVVMKYISSMMEK